MESVFQDRVREIARSGRTVLLSSHILSEVEQLCDRVTIIRSGTAVETGTLNDLRHLSRTSFRVAGLASSGILDSIAGLHDVRTVGDSIEFEVDADSIAAVLQTLAAHEVTGLTVAPASLESLFLRHYATAK